MAMPGVQAGIGSARLDHVRVHCPSFKKELPMTYGGSGFGEILEKYMMEAVGAHDGSQKSAPDQIRLAEYPRKLIDQAFDNATAHPLLTMSHLDIHGDPFCSVMGFSYLDGMINIVARPNAAKIKRLIAHPGFSIIYHNNIPRPEKLACITLCGRAEISHDKERIARANRALSHKVFRDNDPDVDRRQAMIDSMEEAERVLIMMAEVTAVYIVSPMLPDLPAGIPTPVVSWRADRKA
jgi:hypothetical protein